MTLLAYLLRDCIIGGMMMLDLGAVIFSVLNCKGVGFSAIGKDMVYGSTVLLFLLVIAFLV